MSMLELPEVVNDVKCFLVHFAAMLTWLSTLPYTPITGYASSLSPKLPPDHWLLPGQPSFPIRFARRSSSAWHAIGIGRLWEVMTGAL